MSQKSRNYNKNSKNYVDIEPPLKESDGVGYLLSEEERAEIEADIIAEIEEEERKKLKDKYRLEAKDRMRREKGLSEEQVTLTIDIAGYSDAIKLSGKPYYHGHSYTVPLSVAQSLYDIMGRTWDHEESVGGANANEYRKPRETRMLGGRAVQNAPQRNDTGGAPINVPSVSPLSANRLAPKVTSTQNIRG